MSDNLESYFKKQLSDESSGKDDWNVPSDAVWEKTLPKIQKRKGIFIPWRYLYILGMALFIVSGLLLFRTEYFKSDIKTSQGFAQNNSEDTSQNINTGQKEKVSSSLETIKEKKTAKMVANNKKPVEKGLFQGNKHTVKQTKTEHLRIDKTEREKPTMAKKAKTQNEALPKTPEPFREKANGKNIGTKEPNTVLATIETNETRPTKEMIADSSFSLASGRPDIEPVSNKGKLGFGVFFLPTYNSTYISGEMSLGKIETGNTYLFSANYGFEIKYYLTDRFAIATGIQRTQIKSWSKSIMEFAYDSSTEQDMGNGETENTSEIPLMTPFGEIGTSITYRFPSTGNLPDGELMESNFETQQEILYISIPVGIEYNIVASRKINWFAEGGLLFNQSLNNATDFSSRVIHDGNDMKVMGEEMENGPDYTNNFLSYYIGTGINYNLSSSFQIGGSARYFDNLSKLNLQENMSTHLNGFSLKIGIVYFY
ncbi:MAG: hypothetical protein GXO89_12515 [Chlorobi bacterium]|nr:hypothetical protein [Chlorobiota bacterium]